MQFVASLVSSVAWPVVVVVVVVVLRTPLRDALAERSIGALEVGPAGLKLNFVDRVLRNATDAIHQQRASVRTDAGSDSDDHDERSQLLRLADISPNAAVMYAFSLVERALASVIDVEPSRRFVPAREKARMAVNQRWLSPEVARSVDEMAQIRNAIAHGEGALTRPQAENFVNLAQSLLILLRADPPRRSAAVYPVADERSDVGTSSAEVDNGR